jgi:hypothetical protein
MRCGEKNLDLEVEEMSLLLLRQIIPFNFVK